MSRELAFSRNPHHPMGHAHSTAYAQPEPAKRGDESDARSSGALRPIVINPTSCPTTGFTVVGQTVAREKGKEGRKEAE